jgi:ribosomal protein S18 acetylase RimI-like enzyme
VLIRSAALEDMAAVEAARVATWKVAYRGMIPDAYLDALDVRPERIAWLERRFSQGGVATFVAVEGATVVGMATTGPSRDDDLPDVGELYGLYVRAEHWRSGLGSALMRQCGTVTSLWVLEANHRARAFYESQGFAADGHVKEREFGQLVTEVRYVR